MEILKKMWASLHVSFLLPVVFFLTATGVLCATAQPSPYPQVVFDDSVGLGRTFDGIGGLSGGGATSKLLVNYPKDKRDQILDFLFKPNFGASLHILKVEIGGDAQSTDGTEASHMHNSWDENYQRGYEWWLMKEAKLRNPNIKLYGLPWGFPGWIGQGTRSPFTNVNVTADYVIRWINGAKKYHNLTIDFVGIWNERAYSIQYIKTLRAMLDERGFHNTQIIAADKKWEIADDMLKDAGLTNDIYGIGCHYPGTTSSKSAVNTGKPLWSSEDYSTYNDLVGGGCWARILNQNYVNGLMTATISWNLIASYYPSLPFYRDGLMTAVEPWSGNYSVDSPIWLTAHTSQFSSIGWKYLSHGAGVGKLPKGGSYVALASPVGNQLTIVIETMTHDHSKCIRPPLPKYSVESQIVTITLKGSYAPVTEMNVWYSKLDFTGSPSTLFEKREPLKFKEGMANLHLGLDEVITLTTLTAGQKGSFPNPSPSKPFPLPYKDDFESYQLNEEPFNLAQQSGSFEVMPYRHNQVMRQMVLQAPVRWCHGIYKPANLIGDPNCMNEEPFNLAQQSGAWEVMPFRHNQVIRQMVLHAPVLWCSKKFLPIYKPINVIGDPNCDNTISIVVDVIVTTISDNTIPIVVDVIVTTISGNTISIVVDVIVTTISDNTISIVVDVIVTTISDNTISIVVDVIVTTISDNNISIVVDVIVTTIRDNTIYIVVDVIVTTISDNTISIVVDVIVITISDNTISIVVDVIVTTVSVIITISDVSISVLVTTNPSDIIISVVVVVIVASFSDIATAGSIAHSCSLQCSLTYAQFQEPFNLAPQVGSLEVVQSQNASHGSVARSTVIHPPIHWCTGLTLSFPTAVIGDYNWQDVFVEIDFYVPPVNATSGLFVAARVDQGGCMTWAAHGVYMFIGKSKYYVTNDLARTTLIDSGFFPQQLSDTWHRMSLYVKDDIAMGALDGKGLFNVTVPKKPTNGFVAIGTNDFGLADFDNLLIASHSDGLDKMKSYFHQSDLKFVSEKH